MTDVTEKTIREFIGERARVTYSVIVNSDNKEICECRFNESDEVSIKEMAEWVCAAINEKRQREK